MHIRNALCWIIFQTEAEHRRREAGVKQSMEIRLRSCMYVWGMVFGIISRTKTCSATNEVSKCRSPERALLRHNTYHRGPTSSERAARGNAKISSAHSNNAREFWQQPTISSEDGQLRKTRKDKRHCLHLNHAMHAITSSDGH